MRKLEPLIFGIILALVVSMFVAGCSTFALVNQHQFAAQVAVEAATARVLHQHPEWKPGAVSITGAAMEAIDRNVLVDLESLDGYVRSKIDWIRFLPEEQALLSALISEARRNIEDDLRAKNIKQPELQLIEVRKMLSWIHDTAARSGR